MAFDDLRKVLQVAQHGPASATSLLQTPNAKRGRFTRQAPTPGLAGPSTVGSEEPAISLDQGYGSGGGGGVPPLRGLSRQDHFYGICSARRR